MHVAFLAGLSLWSLLAFAGSARYWRAREGPLHAPLRRLKVRSSLLFLLLPFVPLALALRLVRAQSAAVERMDGVLGLEWMLAAPLGMLAAALFGACCFLPDEESEGEPAPTDEPVRVRPVDVGRSRSSVPAPERSATRRHPLG